MNPGLKNMPAYYLYWSSNFWYAENPRQGLWAASKFASLRVTETKGNNIVTTEIVNHFSTY